jgi:methionine-rich copper-binding protein CopC
MGRLIIVVACALASLAGPAATPAQAHSGVRSIEPADGSTLTTAPQAVRLTFTENVLAGTAQLRVTGPGGQVATEPVTQGPRVVGPLPRELTNGAYTVLWRVTSADGHPISGSFGFVLAVAGATSPTPSPSPAATSPSAAPAAAASPAASPVNPLDPASAADGLGSGAKILLALGAVLAGLAAVGGLWARSRRRP